MTSEFENHFKVYFQGFRYQKKFIITINIFSKITACPTHPENN